MKMPYAVCEKISSKFTADTFEECLKMNREIADNPEYAELLRIAGQISGRVRNMSMHAGGVCVSNKEITDYKIRRKDRTAMKIVKNPDTDYVKTMKKRLKSNSGYHECHAVFQELYAANRGLFNR